MKHYIILFYAFWLNKIIKLLMLSNATMKLRFLPGFNTLRFFNASAKAYAVFVKAKNNVPAYAEFLISKKFNRPSFTGILPNINEIPETDKENYIKVFPLGYRCVNGQIPDKGVVIDESSGSSGTATNWVRGQKERAENAKMIQFGMKQLFNNKPLFIINAFALGPWATGVNITMSCVKFSKLKSLGPDKLKIENTIKQFGKDHQYVIMGYPPFLKSWVDSSEIDFKNHNISFIFGGESMSEGMRDYLQNKGIKKIYSSYGASDLELNIAAENDFTISFRKLLQSNKKLRDKILKHTGALPMIFQYNPADFFIETSKNGELVATICRPNYISPKIKYNIHDRGHTLQIKKLYQVLKELNIDVELLVKPKIDLPILLHYGRADSSVSFFGANISPNDIQEAIYNTANLANAVHSFCIKIQEDKNGSKQLEISLEMNENKKQTDFAIEKLKETFFEQLAKTNQDFREAQKMLTNNNQTVIKLFEFNQGLFANNDIRIKSKYIG
jgi:phenylacetate-CoA ligase